ncbi:unnamed protein product [Cochlearia groenlandica]
MDREKRRISTCRNGTPHYTNGKFRDDNVYGFLDRSSEEKSPCRSSPSKILRIPSPTSSPPYPGSTSPDRGYIEHRISKFDTLAGIAIKYGVEVSDVKKMNGLVTDLQMFALKSLKIPLPGRHPPSPCLLSNGSLNHGEGCSCHQMESPNHSNNNDVFNSFQSLRLNSSEKKVTPAMYSLQGYYGLKPANRTVSEGGCFEMGDYKTETCHHLSNNGDNQYLRPFPSTNIPLNHHRKSRSLANALLEEVNNQESYSDKFRTRRQKSEADFSSRTPELLLKEESSSSNGGFLSIAGKGLALRLKASSRNNLSAESEMCSFNQVPINLMDGPVSDSFCSVRKSSSASSIQDPDSNTNNSSSLSLWPDLLTPAAITSSIFDGLPKPLSGRKNKTAMD